MNRKVLLGVVIVLTVITAIVHGSFAAGMLFGRPPGGPGGAGGGNRQFQNGGTPQVGGTQQAGGGGNGQGIGGGGGNGQGNGGGGGNGQGNGGGGGGNRPPGGFRPGGAPLSFLFRFLPYLFVLNAVGYLVLLSLIVFKVPYFKDHAALAHWLLIAFAAVTFVAYFGVNGFGGFLRNPAAIVAKVDEILLIIFTFLHMRAIKSGGAAPAAPAAPAAAA